MLHVVLASSIVVGVCEVSLAKPITMKETKIISMPQKYIKVKRTFGSGQITKSNSIIVGSVTAVNQLVDVIGPIRIVAFAHVNSAQNELNNAYPN